MPIYEYRCESCGKEEEKLQKYGDPPPPCNDPQCTRHGQPMHKRISRTHFELKGGGWGSDGYGS